MRAEKHTCYRCGRVGIRGFEFTGKAGIGAWFDAQSQAVCVNTKACEKRQRKAEKEQGWT